MKVPKKLSSADDLRVGIAIARDDFDLVPKLDEHAIADALRHEAGRTEYPHFLLAVADALDDPTAEYQLRLVQRRRGRPAMRSSESDLARAYFIEWRMRDGKTPLKAAVMDAMERFECSRATVFRSLKRHRELSKIAKQLDFGLRRGDAP